MRAGHSLTEGLTDALRIRCAWRWSTRHALWRDCRLKSGRRSQRRSMSSSSSVSSGDRGRRVQQPPTQPRACQSRRSGQTLSCSCAPMSRLGFGDFPFCFLRQTRGLEYCLSQTRAYSFRARICVACRAIQTSQQPVPLFRLLFRLKTNRSGTGTAARAHQRQSASACALTVPRSAT